jgi:hypothetical protein
MSIIEEKNDTEKWMQPFRLRSREEHNPTVAAESDHPNR